MKKDGEPRKQSFFLAQQLAVLGMLTFLLLPAQLSAQGIQATVVGRAVCFVDGNEIPIKRAKVKIFNADLLLLPELMGEGYTDDNGNYEIDVKGSDWFNDYPDPYVQVEAVSTGIEVKDRGGPMAYTYCMKSQTRWDLPIEGYDDFGTLKPGNAEACFGGVDVSTEDIAWSLYTYGIEAYSWLRQITTQNPGREPPKVTIFFPSWEADVEGSSFYMPVLNEIHMLRGQTTDDNLWHEYGHHMLYSFSESPSPNYINGVCDSNLFGGHCGYREELGNIHWTEGWPNYLSAALSIVYGRWSSFMLEHLSDFDDANEQLPHTGDDPYRVEHYTAAILLDLIDSNDNRDIYSTDPLRQWRDHVEHSFRDLWNLLMDYDPDPSDLQHNHITDIREFWDGYVTNYPAETNLLAEVFRGNRLADDQGAADIYLHDLSWSDVQAAAGDQIPLNLVIENRGNYQTDDFQVEVLWYRGMDKVVLLDFSVPGLGTSPPGNTYTWSGVVSLPTTMPAATYKVWATVDANWDVFEGGAGDITAGFNDPELNNYVFLFDLTIGEDYDNDGFISSQDCDDSNPRIRPSAEEVCDGIDNNCDGQIDEGLPNDCGPIYVRWNAGGVPSDGSSWHRAYRTLQEALAVAVSGQEVWVSEGTYRPDEGLTSSPSDPRSAAFVLSSGVAVYGGFGGFEHLRSERDVQSHPTLLSGDIGEQGVRSDNAYHVVETELHVPASTVLDGFTIRDGLANGSGSTQTVGAGLLVLGSPTIANCFITENNADLRGAGGAVTNPWGVAPTFTNCTFLDNAASYDGGGLWLVSGVEGQRTRATLSNCVFNANHAKNGRGGAVWVGSAAEASVINTTLVGNAAVAGGALYGESGGIFTIRNAVLWDNSAKSGAQVALSTAIADVDYSALQGGGAAVLLTGGATLSWGSHNVMESVSFTDRAGDDGIPGTIDDDLRLLKGTPGFDAGNNAALPTDTADLDADGDVAEPLPMDLGGRPRIRYDFVDLGAYEAGEQVYFVNLKAAGANTGLDWSDAYNHLQDALRVARLGDVIRVAEGIHKPDRGLGRSGGDRDSTFLLKSGVTVVGGYKAGTNTWDPNQYRSVLSGDLNGDDAPDFGNFSDNAYHVVTANSTGPNTVLEGFTIQGGNAEPNYHPANKGGGILNIGGNLIARRCSFEGNRATHRGGGMWNGGGGTPTLDDCQFLGNRAIDGGGIANETGHPLISGSTFFENRAIGGSGGAMYSNAASVSSLDHSLLLGNRAVHGGALANDSGTTLSVKSCTLVGNVAEGGPLAAPSRGGAVRAYDTVGVTLTNSILWLNHAAAGYGAEVAVEGGQLTVRYSDAAGGASAVYQAGGASIDWDDSNLDADPLFVDPFGADQIVGTIDDDLRLGPFSLAVDSGDPTSDYFNEPNVPAGANGGRINLGRYGNTSEATSSMRAAGSILYVDGGGSLPTRGDTWTYGFRDLQYALAVARPGDQIWVAVGRYTPDQGPNLNPGERGASFALRDGVTVYGGFPPGGGAWSSRNPEVNRTRLSGDLLGDDGAGFSNYSDNSLHVVIGSGTGPTAVLDGFVVEAGYAEPAELSYPATGGAGMYNEGGSPTVRYCRFERNLAPGRGGGGMLNHSSSSPTIDRCVFFDNQGGNGGALYNAYGSSSLVRNTLFHQNQGNYGGAIELVYSSNVTLENVTVADNTAVTMGGGLHVYSSSPIIRNSIFWNNAAPAGPQIGLSSATASLSYSDIQGGAAAVVGTGLAVGSGLLENVDPLFVTGDDYRLSNRSPCIDTGDPGAEFGNEPDAPYGRINQGWYGNTYQAAVPDRDLDGARDDLDAFLDDPAAALDKDGDGYPDTWNHNMSQADSTTGLRLDAFPSDRAASLDTDGDGFPDAWNDGMSQADSTTGLRLDAFPSDPKRWLPISRIINAIHLLLLQDQK